MRVLLDTSICIAILRGNPKAIARLSALPQSACVVSTISVYELFAGVEKCRNPSAERAKVEQLLAVVRPLPLDSAAAQEAAIIRASLERSGSVCGPYDLLIAGHAAALGLPVATHNIGEFSRVPGLLIEDWLA